MGGAIVKTSEGWWKEQGGRKLLPRARMREQEVM